MKKLEIRSQKSGGVKKSLIRLVRGFTLVELLVSIAIFAMMTALVVAKYGNFNQGVLLTNLAYDIALTLRTAQTYGLSVKSADTSSAQFQSGYGVHFDTNSGVNRTMVFFADIHPSGGNGIYTANSDRLISTYTIKRGAYISGMCLVVAGCSNPSAGFVDVTFKRPDPTARICTGNPCSSPRSYIEIILTGGDGGKRSVTVRENGQITVKDQ